MNYKSLGEIMWSVTNNPLVTNINMEDAAESAMRLLKTLKLPLSTVTNSVTYDIVDYKVKLPETLVKINAVRDNKNGVNLLYGSNPFFETDLNNTRNECNCEPGTYVVQGCNIITSIEDGEITVSFESLAVDEDGYPMIPDDASMENAIRYHIMYEYLEGLWYVGKVTDKVFQHVSQQRDWYVGQVSSSMKLLNMDHANAIANSINRLIVDDYMHQRNYTGAHTSSQFKKRR